MASVFRGQASSLCTFLFVAGSALALSQGSQTRITLTANADAGMVFEALFAQANVRYSVPKIWHRTVSEDFEDTPFQQALDRLSRDAEARFEETNGLYKVYPIPIDFHLTFDQVNIRDALKEVFKRVGRSYSVEPEVQGTVTANIKKANLDVALGVLLAQVDATYRVDDDIFMILKRTVPKPPAEPPLNPTDRVRIIITDPRPVIVLRRSISIIATREKCRDLLAEVFRQGKCHYIIGPKVSGTASVDFKEVSFDQALEDMLSKAKTKVRVVEDTYIIE